MFCIGLLFGLLVIGNAQLIEDLEHELGLTKEEVQKKLENFCVLLPDGEYEAGCQNEYIVCSGSVTYVMKCPEDLVHDEHHMPCLRRTDVELCQQSVRVLPEFIEVLNVSTEIEEGDVKPSLPALEEFCRQNTDGYYALNCSSHYVACISFMPTLMSCPAKLKYDAQIRMCLPAFDVEVCNDMIPEAVHNFVQGIRDVSTTTTILEPETEEPESSTTTSATTTTAEPETEAPETSTTTVTSTTEATDNEPVVISSAEVSCEGVERGTYALGCVPQYVLCINETGIILECSEPLVFDQDTEQCQPKERVSACIDATETSGTPEIETTTTEATAMPSSIVNFEALYQFSEPVPFNAADLSCVGVQNGLYALGCMPEFVLCFYEEGMLLHCKNNSWVFDEQTQRCQPEDQVEECMHEKEMEESTTTVETTTTAETTTTTEATTTTETTTTTEIGSTAPMRRPVVNGLVGFAVVRTTLTTTELPTSTDPEEEVVDEENAVDEENVVNGENVVDEENVVEDEVEGGNVETDPGSRRLQIRWGRPQAQNIQEEERKLEPVAGLPDQFSCNGRETGIYALNCSDVFVLCQSNRAVYLRCPKYYIFDDAAGECKKEVEGCQTPKHDMEDFAEPSHHDQIEMQEESQMLLLVSHKKKYYIPLMRKHAQEASENKTTEGTGESAYSAFSCRGHRDGVYPIPDCDSTFVVCDSGESVLLHCPEDQVLNEKTRKCSPETSNRRKRYAYPGIGMVSPMNTYPACYGMRYGVFTYSCSSTYIVSLPHFCNRYVCPPGLVYCPYSHRCLMPARVPACAVGAGRV